MKPLRICVDARMGEGWGGVQQMVLGLAAGLSALPGEEEYLFLTRRGGASWLAPHLGPRMRLVEGARGGVEGLRRALRKGANAVVELLDRSVPRVPGLRLPARSDGTAERRRADLVHFTAQSAFLTRLPSIYHPHDLQHLHLPELFSPEERAKRERNYRLFCARARVVAVASSWTRDDVVRRYGIAPEKVVVVPLAPSTAAYAEAAPAERRAIRARLALPQGFALYPAQTWPHKNHLRLLEALALLRSRGLLVPLVCTGALTDHHAAVMERARELDLAGQVRFLGFVSPEELQVLYQECTLVVIPSLFEAGSFPLWEAMRAGVPAACSNVTSLPLQAGDAALVFDPRDPGAIAGAVERLWTDRGLREELGRRGRLRVAQFTWVETARRFRALYRRVGGRETAEDRELLSAPPML